MQKKLLAAAVQAAFKTGEDRDPSDRVPVQALVGGSSVPAKGVTIPDDDLGVGVPPDFREPTQAL